MKTRTKVLLIVISLAVFIPQNIKAEEKYNPVGMWEFSVPDAPYGYNNGKIEVKMEEEKYVVGVSFEGIEYKFIGEMVFFSDDKFSFSLYIEGEDIHMNFEFLEKDKMNGKAEYSGGVLPMTAKRVVEKE